jgi:hypothetical protein
VFDRTIDRDFNFTLEFTGVAAGDYSFNTYGTVDGGRVATEADRITVTDTVPSRAAWPFSELPLWLACACVAVLLPD